MMMMMMQSTFLILGAVGFAPLQRMSTRVSHPRFAHTEQGLQEEHRVLQADDDVAALQSEAARLRAEVAALESSMREEQSVVTESRVDAFFELADSDGDGLVTLEELSAALRASGLRPRGGSAEAAFQALDANGDGVLQRDEFVSLPALKARLEEAWTLEAALTTESSSTVKDAKLEELGEERVAVFESLANSTAAGARIAAVTAYALPLLDAVPQAWAGAPSNDYLNDFILGVSNQAAPESSINAVQQALGSAATVYHALPFSGLIIFFVLSSLASNAAAPRLARFSARHAIILDIAASLLLPLAEGSGSPYAHFARPAFEALVAASAVAAALGTSASFVPVTGQLTKKFTDDYDETARRIIKATTAIDSDANNSNNSGGDGPTMA
jgi:hypothetical protein